MLNSQAIREQLTNLPEGLDETYDQILLGIIKKYCGYTKTVLLWLCFAIHPMALKELVATENGPQIEQTSRYLRCSEDVLQFCY